jgi:hypothetical protein
MKRGWISFDGGERWRVKRERVGSEKKKLNHPLNFCTAVPYMKEGH